MSTEEISGNYFLRRFHNYFTVTLHSEAKIKSHMLVMAHVALISVVLLMRKEIYFNHVGE